MSKPKPCHMGTAFIFVLAALAAPLTVAADGGNTAVIHACVQQGSQSEAIP